MPIAFSLDEGFRAGGCGVFTKHIFQRRQKRPFPVTASSVKEIETLFAGIANQTVTGKPLQIGLKIPIVRGNSIEKRQPFRTFAARRGIRDFYNEILSLMWPQFSRLQVDSPARRVERP